MRRFLASGGLAWVGGGILALFFVLAGLAPVLAPYAPEAMDEPLLPPSPRHLLGTNDVGQDIFSELLYGARLSLLAGGVSAIASTAIGLLVGAVAGYYDRLGFVLMRVVDVLLAVPRFPLIVFAAAFLRPSVWTLILFFIVFGWPCTCRVVRSHILKERKSAYVEAAISIGAPDRRLIVRHLLPSAATLALARFVGEFQHVILAEAGLSFLGLGDPTAKSWGMMLHYALDYPIIYISDLWMRWALPPGLCITIVVLALTLVGFSFERQANPTLRGGGYGYGRAQTKTRRPEDPPTPAG